MTYQVLEAARDKFTQEISFQSKDKDISLAKVTSLVLPCSVCYARLNKYHWLILELLNANSKVCILCFMNPSFIPILLLPL